MVDWLLPGSRSSLATLVRLGVGESDGSRGVAYFKAGEAPDSGMMDDEIAEAGEEERAEEGGEENRRRAKAQRREEGTQKGGEKRGKGGSPKVVRTLDLKLSLTGLSEQLYL